MLDLINEYGNCASFLGLILSFITMLLTGTVRNRVNSILKNQKEEDEIRKNRNKFIKNIDAILTYVKTNDNIQMFSKECYEQLDEIVQCYINNWNTLNKFDKRFGSLIKNIQFRYRWSSVKKMFINRLEEQGSKNEVKNNNVELTSYISFLVYLKTFVK